MQISILNGQVADVIDVSVKCVDGGGSFTINDPVCFVVAGASVDGISALGGTPATSWAGIARSNIAINGYGVARAWGYQASVRLSHEGSSLTITAGDCMYPRATRALGLTSTTAALTILNTKYAVCMATTTASAAAYTKALMRAL